MKKKSPVLDAGFGTLIADVKDRERTDTTPVIGTGGSGRGPRPGQGTGNNGTAGGGHFAKC